MRISDWSSDVCSSDLIVQQPQILAALNPLHAWDFLVSRGWKMFAAMSAIVLALTGAEALYADLGHFGRKPIQLAWDSVVLPGLRSEEHTSELQSLMRISYAVF